MWGSLVWFTVAAPKWDLLACSQRRVRHPQGSDYPKFSHKCLEQFGTAKHMHAADSCCMLHLKAFHEPDWQVPVTECAGLLQGSNIQKQKRWTQDQSLVTIKWQQKNQTRGKVLCSSKLFTFNDCDWNAQKPKKHHVEIERAPTFVVAAELMKRREALWTAACVGCTHSVTALAQIRIPSTMWKGSNATAKRHMYYLSVWFTA